MKCMSGGLNIKNAIELAQNCTTLVVQKHGVSTVTQEELNNYE